MNLYCREYGRPEGQPLCLLHGLLGSSSNWGLVARGLEPDYRVLAPDLRNHGRSPHDAEMSYPTMAEDLLRLLDRLAIERVTLVGHSMGGKVAMWLALHYPDRVAGLVPVDIAPVSYNNRFREIFRALADLDLDKLTDRQSAQRALAGRLDSAALRNYLLQNLVYRDGVWCWRINRVAIERALAVLLGFPQIEAERQFLGSVLFIYGGESNYLSPKAQRAIHQLFPFARLRGVPGAGHWVYAEQPEAFVGALRSFLARL